MHKLEINLKQHTPIIHFQHDQEGATLRATELKPKLDLAILNHILKQKVSLSEFKEDKLKLLAELKENNREHWLVGKGAPKQLAFDYKIRIDPPSGDPVKYVLGSDISNDIKEKYEGKGFKVLAKTPYFANNPDLESIDPSKLKLGLLYPEDKKAKVIIRCFDADLAQSIKDVVDDVFIFENFGTRQNKGFGCFLTNNIKSKNTFEAKLSNHDTYKDSLILRDTFTDLASVFEKLTGEYQRIKSGKPGSRTPSILEQFVKKSREYENKQNEKKVVKAKFLDRNNVMDEDLKKTIFYRPVLGLAGLHEYTKDKSPNSVKVNIQANLEIERFKSPINFKIVKFDSNYYIYLMPNYTIPPKIAQAKYTFSVDTIGALELETVKNFNMKNFIKEIKESGPWRSIRR